MRIWGGSVSQQLIDKYAFKRIDYLNHKDLWHYYPLNNYSQNNPVQLTDLVGLNNGSLGQAGLTDPISWDDDNNGQPAFSQIIEKPTLESKDINYVTISWNYDNTFPFTGFDLIIDGNKYNDSPIPLASRNNYKIEGLSPATSYDIRVKGLGIQRVVDNVSELLNASTINPNATDSFNTTLTLMDRYGNGWGDGYISIVDDTGNEIFNGTLQGAYEKSVSLELEEIEYCGTITGAPYPSDVSWEIHLEDGTLIAQAGGNETFCFTPPEEYIPSPIKVTDRTLEASNVQSDQFTVENTFANSNTGSTLTYTIYASQSPNLDGDVASIKANAEASQEFLYSQIGVFTDIYNLSSDTLYYYNLVVEDTQGNALAYTMNSVKTLPSG